MLSTYNLRRSKDTNWLEVKGWKKMFRENGNQQKVGFTLIISEKIHCKTKILIRDKETSYNNKKIYASRRYNNYKHVSNY